MYHLQYNKTEAGFDFSFSYVEILTKLIVVGGVSVDLNLVDMVATERYL